MLGKPLRLVVMGTGPFAAPTFRGLCRSHHEVVLLVTQPLREVAGRKAPAISPMRTIAVEQGLPIFDPDSINTDTARDELLRYRPDLFIVADYGQILAPQTLAAAPLGGINLHGSLLPKYRGAAPINWALYHGETETGVTVIHMTPQIDAGPCLAQASLAIWPEETAAELETRLAELGAPLVLSTIDALQSGQSTTIAQDKSKSTKAPRLKKSDGLIDWSRSALAIKSQIRALEPWPKAYTFWHRHGGGEPLRLILGQVSVVDTETSAAPGSVVHSDGHELLIATGQGQLSIQSLQPAGKRVLTAEEFLRGYPLVVGQQLKSS